MTVPACPYCSTISKQADIVPDGTYGFHETMLVSWRCACGTNRAARFQDVRPELRRAAMLADLARDSGNEMEG